MGDRSGEQFGDYQLLSLLGVGTFGEVYIGEHIYLKTQVAIKILHAHLNQMEFQRFVEEARTIAALEHPHIVRILSFSLEQHTPYLVMQLAQGSLKDHFVPGQPQPAVTLLPYLKQAAEGVQYAHDQRVMHLDIKPANLLLTSRDQLLLADFGLARVLQTQRTHQTMPGFAGTPAYAAPEQFQNKPSLASDQYALGVLVYQWLTGTLPFEGDWWAIGHQKLTKLPPPLRTRVKSLPPAIEEMVLRALATDPRDRFAAVSAFAAAFEQACLSAPLSTQQSTLQPRISLPTTFPHASSRLKGERASPPGAPSGETPAREEMTGRRGETWHESMVQVVESAQLPKGNVSLRNQTPPPPAVPHWDDWDREPPRRKRTRWNARRPVLVLSLLVAVVVVGVLVAALPGVRSSLLFFLPTGNSPSNHPSVSQSRLTVQVDAPGATVQVDTRSFTTQAIQPAPFSSVSIEGLAPGSHAITIQAPQFSDYAGTLVMPAHDTTITAWLAPNAEQLTALADQFQPATQPDPGVAGDHYSATKTATSTLTITITYILGGLDDMSYASVLAQGSDTQNPAFQLATLTLTPDIVFSNAIGTQLLEYKPDALPISTFALQMPLTLDSKGAFQFGTPTVTLPANVTTDFTGPAKNDLALYYAIASVLPDDTTALSFSCIGAVDTNNFNPEDGLLIVETGGAHYFYRWGILWAVNSIAKTLAPNVLYALPGSNEFEEANTARANGDCG
jgi:serine/threonine protein kinase